MGFDPIQHAMCDDNVKQEVKRQRLFGVDEHKISARASDITNDEFFYGPIGFSYISELTPTKEEIEKGEIYIPFGDEKLKLRIGKVLFDNELVYGGQVYQGNSVSETYLAIAYKLGEIDGFNIPKTGVYLHVEDNTSSELFFVIEYETIHPIDPKFLPGVCLPVVELSTEIPLSDGTAPTKLTTEESEQINKATANGLPFVLKLPGELSILMNKANYFYTGVYHLDVMVTVMLVSDGSGGWSAGMAAAKVSG